MLALALAFLSMFSGEGSNPGNCGCVKANRDEMTREGGNRRIVYVYRRPFKQIWGIVGFPKEANLLVEVFTHPEYLLPEFPKEREQLIRDQQRRVAACKTTPGGRFGFRNLPAGTYELRVSKDREWNPTRLYLVLNPHDRRSSNKKIDVELVIGN